jgi:translation initiation factor 2A
VTSPSPNTDSRKPRKRKGPKEKGGARDNAGAGAGAAEPSAAAEPAALVVETGELAVPVNEGSVPPTPGVELLDPAQKKLRNVSGVYVTRLRVLSPSTTYDGRVFVVG